MTARFSPLLHPHSGAGTNVSLSPSGPGRGNKSRIKIPLRPTWAICGAEPFLVPFAVRSPQHEGGDAAGRAASDREQRLPALALRYVKCHHPPSFRLLVKKPSWDKRPGGTRAVYTALASNLGLLRAHRLVDTCKNKRPHFLLHYFTKIEKILWREYDPFRRKHSPSKENEHVFPPTEG